MTRPKPYDPKLIRYLQLAYETGKLSGDAVMGYLCIHSDFIANGRVPVSARGDAPQHLAAYEELLKLKWITQSDAGYSPAARILRAIEGGN